MARSARSGPETECVKDPTEPHDGGMGHGLLTAACCNCWQLTGFSILQGPESPKAVFDVLVTRLTCDKTEVTGTHMQSERAMSDQASGERQ